jgi:signal transduction histidine kinase
MNLDVQGVAVVVDGLGRIRSVEHFDFCGAPDLAFGQSLAEWVDGSSSAKSAGFLRAAREVGTAWNWEMSVPIEGIPLLMHFAGGSLEEGEVVALVARTRGGLLRLAEEQWEKRPDVARRLIRAAGENLDQEIRTSQQFDELTSLHHAMANLHRELSRSHAELQRMGERRSRFLAIVAHDLRSPLTAIIGYAEMLAGEAELSAEHADMLRIIRDSAESARRLIEDLLSGSAIEIGQLQLHLQPCDLRDIARRQIEQAEVRASRRHVSLRLEAPESPLRATCDETKLEQAVANLVGNAIKYSPAGGEVTVALRQQNGTVEIAVCDQGPGVTPEELPKLCRPFARGPVPPLSGEPGAGLGLFVTSRIAEAHGGSLEIPQQRKQGGCFTLKLPMEPPTGASANL